MSLNASAVITLADLKVRLEVSETKDADDNLYERLIESVSSYLETYLGRKIISPAAADEIFDGTGIDTYHVKNQHFQNIVADAPVISYRSGDGTDWTVMSTSEYPREFDIDTGMVWLVNGLVFTTGKRNYKINHRYGYLITDVPESIKIAASELVERCRKRMDKTGLKSVKVGEAVTSYDLGSLMNPAIKVLLDGYRRITFG